MYETGLDTKTRIFHSSLRLFATDGVESTTTRGIADAANIKCASIYNHYKSKDDILLECYEYFENHKSEYQLTKEQYIPILLNGTKEEVINAPNYEVCKEKYENFVYALMVAFARIHTDSRARDIYLANKSSGFAYLNEFFETGIEVGRFDHFDYQPVSNAYISIKLNSAHSISIEPKNNELLLENQAKMINLLIGLIPFRY
ncbi:MAG: TetR/AcrR family transcriptional regulator [Firmicutes bacterium]|nr:TetR/AcrR family transcriptional regulator [Bacillota bacterium]